MSARLRRLWQRRSPAAALLLPLALLNGGLVRLRRQLYAAGLLRSERLPVPVIVVGNVVAGGGGKTPVTRALVKHLQARGWRPGVVSRGYGRADAQLRAVRPDSDARAVGDEPLLLARATGAPVFVARRRAEAGRALLAAHPEVDVLVCDDGLQHLALARDLEICVFNDQGVGNGWLLPAGPLREPWPRPADWVLHAGAPPPGRHAARFALQRHLADHAVDGHGRRVPLASLAGTRLHAVAGTARPEEFFALLRARGLAPVHCEALPDHHGFIGWQPPKDEGTMVLCTEKDAVKLWPRHPQVLAVPLQIQLDPLFFQALDARLASLRSSPAP